MLTDKLVWLDMEMTGLNPKEDTIIEIASIVTDGALNIIAEGPSLVIHQSDARLQAMDAWNQSHHGASGLVDDVKKSSISLVEAERETLAFLSQHVQSGASPLCGNSVCQDKQFLMEHMPNLAQFFHYRLLDVSSLKIAWMLWLKDHPLFDKGTVPHRALEDIRLSIEECRYYRQALLNKDG